MSPEYFSAKELTQKLGVGRSFIYKRLRELNLTLPSRSISDQELISLFERKPRKPQIQHYICHFCNVPQTMTSGRRRKFCKKCVPDCRAENRLSHFGLTEIEFNEMLNNQNGKCAICEKFLARNKTKLTPNFATIDHNHKTNQIRGLLCTGCNMKLGHMEDKVWCEKAEKYLKNTANSINLVLNRSVRYLNE